MFPMPVSIHPHLSDIPSPASQLLPALIQDARDSSSLQLPVTDGLQRHSQPVHPPFGDLQRGAVAGNCMWPSAPARRPPALTPPYSTPPDFMPPLYAHRAGLREELVAVRVIRGGRRVSCLPARLLTDPLPGPYSTPSRAFSLTAAM